MPTRKTEETAAAKPRTRKATAPEPVVEAVPEQKPDRNMWRALAILAAAVIFGGGYLVGHAVGDHEFRRGDRGAIGVYMDEFPMGGGHHLPGMIPFGMGSMPYPGTPNQPDDPGDVVEGGGYLGIRGVDTPGAVLIVEVAPGSPAEDAGVENGDRVISFGGTSIASMEQLADLVRDTAPGTEVEMVLGGPGGGHSVTVTVGERPADE